MTAQAQLRGRLPLPVALVSAAILLVVVLALGVAIGPVAIGPGEVARIVWAHLTGGGSTNTPADDIVWQIRVPRVLLAATVGAALTTAGTVVQVLVRNALADPFLLGISSGASVGATAVLLFGALGGLGTYALATGSVTGALVATASVFAIARSGRQLAPTQLILTGVVMSALFESLASYLLFRGNPQATQSVLFYLLGSFGNATFGQLTIPAVVLLVALVLLLGQARVLNALAMGPGPAASLGIDVRRARNLLFVLASVLAGVSVAVSGIIGFVGLVIPHLVRLLVRSDHRRVLPVGMLLGAAFMAASDLLARTLVAPQEMPVGVITAVIGAPTLLLLIRRRPDAYGAPG